jgi:hypothetical protein
MVITVGMTILAMNYELFLRFQSENAWLMIVAVIALVICEIYILCC